MFCGPCDFYVRAAYSSPPLLGKVRCLSRILFCFCFSAKSLQVQPILSTQRHREARAHFLVCNSSGSVMQRQGLWDQCAFLLPLFPRLSELRASYIKKVHLLNEEEQYSLQVTCLYFNLLLQALPEMLTFSVWRLHFHTPPPLFHISEMRV